VEERLAKRIKRSVRFRGIQLALALVRSLPLRLAQRIGAGFGNLAYALARGERQKALASLETAFPDRPPQERDAIARGCFRHFGRAAFELAQTDTLARQMDRWIDWPEASRAAFHAALSRGKGMVYVTCHIGNWELMAWRIARECSFWAIGKPTTDPRLQSYVEKIRAKGNVQAIWRGDSGSARQILSALKNDGVLAILIDQDTRVQSVFVPFFGKLAATPRAAADLVLRTGAAAFVGYSLRQPDGRYCIQTREVAFQPGGDREADVLKLTERFSSEIEQAIREAPEQWVWMHQRWKTRPC
jgi:KDO2-lipid IV(A) lauroyltransferase